MSEASEPIPESVLSRAEATVAARPINEASNFFSFREADEATGQAYWFFLDSPENVHQIDYMPTGIVEIPLHSRRPSRAWRGEKIGRLELCGLPFVAFKVFPLNK